MAARGVAFQPLAHQTVKTVEPLAHVGGPGGHVDPRGRSKPEHRLRPVQYSQQALQCPRIESTTHFDPTPASRLNHKCAIPLDIAVCLPRRRPNHFNGNHRPGYRSRPTMRLSTIFIQRRGSQASLPAKRFPHQSTGFKLRNQSCGLDPATSPPHYQFAHNCSAPLNPAAQQGALLRRIPSACRCREKHPESQTQEWSCAYSRSVTHHNQPQRQAQPLVVAVSKGLQ